MKLFNVVFVLGMLLHAQTSFAKLTILACEPEWASLAEEIGKDKVKVYSATTGKQDPHHIQARPSLIAKARRADLLICSGAELESGWLPLLLNKAGNRQILQGNAGHLMTTEHVNLLDKPQKLDRSMGDIHAAGNPHIHLNPHNILKVANELTKRLIQIDDANKPAYENNLSVFLEKWNESILRWEKQAESLRKASFAVNHKNWVYLADWLGIDMSITLEEKVGVPPTTDYLSRLISTVNEKSIKKIIYSSHSSSRAANWLAKKTDTAVIQLPYTVGGSEKVNNLFELFEETLRLLKS